MEARARGGRGRASMRPLRSVALAGLLLFLAGEAEGFGAALPAWGALRGGHGSAPGALGGGGGGPVRLSGEKARRRRAPASAGGALGLAASSSAADMFVRQQEEAARDRREQAARREIADALDLRDPQARQRLLSREYWMSLSRGLTITDDPRAATLAGAGRPGLAGAPWGRGGAEGTPELLVARGFSATRGLDWGGGCGVDMQAIADTIQSLKENGWPPVFVFMYDETWRMCEGLFDVMGPLLGDVGVELEASVYGWALDAPERAADGVERVGGNFAQPHRDQPYGACHLPDGTPSIMSVWVPMVDVGLDNGCMYVIPREHDNLFDKDSDPAHLEPHKNVFPFGSLMPLPGDAGTVFCWHPNTIHWGSGEGHYAQSPPRKSLAMSFRLPLARQEFTDKEMRTCGRLPYTREELQRGVGMEARWDLCSKGVLMYSVWHPEFHGFNKANLGL